MVVIQREARGSATRGLKTRASSLRSNGHGSPTAPCPYVERKLADDSVRFRPRAYRQRQWRTGGSRASRGRPPSSRTTAMSRRRATRRRRPPRPRAPPGSPTTAAGPTAPWPRRPCSPPRRAATCPPSPSASLPRPPPRPRVEDRCPLEEERCPLGEDRRLRSQGGRAIPPPRRRRGSPRAPAGRTIRSRRCALISSAFHLLMNPIDS